MQETTNKKKQIILNTEALRILMFVVGFNLENENESKEHKKFCRKLMTLTDLLFVKDKDIFIVSYFHQLLRKKYFEKKSTRITQHCQYWNTERY
ncbi:MAG: hypothetical protein D8M62_10675 [Proteobacteria bacterium]|nr:hypothetical protein [Pseudomonadota bacterium]